MSNTPKASGAATMRRWRLPIIVLAPLMLAACVPPPATDADHDAWRPKGLNAANLAAMVQNPSDLIHGRGDTGPDRKLAAGAVTKLWANPTTALPQSGASAAAAAGGTSSAGGSSSAGGDSSGGESGGGGSSAGGASPTAAGN